MDNARKPSMEAQHYIGDGVYASFDGFQIWLRAPTLEGEKRIALEPDTLVGLERYKDKIREAFNAPDWAKA